MLRVRRENKAFKNLSLYPLLKETYRGHELQVGNFLMNIKTLKGEKFIAIPLPHFVMFNKDLFNEGNGEQSANNALQTGSRSVRTKVIGSQLLS